MKNVINFRGLFYVVVFAVLAMLTIQFFVVDDGSSPAGNSSGIASFDGDSPIADEDFDGLPQPAVIPNTVSEPERRSGLEQEGYGYPLIAEFNMPERVAPDYAPKHAYKGPKARIAIIIDDVGMNRRMSKAMIEVKDAPLTLAFLPYAVGLPELTAAAQKNGHELMIHMPMEPMDGSIDTGPIALMDAMGRADVDAMLDKAFASFDGYAGMNNHMGSRVTQNEQAMGWVMDALVERDLFYVDSKTIASSISADQARLSGIDYAERDVFLDHEDSPEFVKAALSKAEAIARKRGYAIAIGHPKKVTYRALAAWIPGLEARGFEVVPVSELLLSPDADARLAKIEVSAGDEGDEDGIYSLAQ